MVPSFRYSGKEIIKLGFRVEVFLQPEYPFVFYEVPDFAVRIEQVPEFPRPRRAGLHAGGVASLPYPLDAERAFFHHVFHPRSVSQIMDLRIHFLRRHGRLRPVEDPPLVGAGGDAVPAADAPVVIHDHDAVRFLPGGLHRTDLHAGGIFALLALNGHVQEPRFGDGFGIVVMLRILQVDQASLLQPDHPYPVQLRVDAGLVVFLHAGRTRTAGTRCSAKGRGRIPTGRRERPAAC